MAQHLKRTSVIHTMIIAQNTTYDHCSRYDTSVYKCDSFRLSLDLRYSDPLVLRQSNPKTLLSDLSSSDKETHINRVMIRSPLTCQPDLSTLIYSVNKIPTQVSADGFLN